MAAEAPDQSTIATVPGAPALRPHRLPSEESAVIDAAAELRAAAAALRAAGGTAELSAALTMSQKSAKRRGLLALVSGAISLGYLVVDVLHERQRGAAEIEQRVDRLEDKVDAVAEDVAAIAAALDR